MKAEIAKLQAAQTDLQIAMIETKRNHIDLFNSHPNQTTRWSTAMLLPTSVHHSHVLGSPMQATHALLQESLELGNFRKSSDQTRALTRRPTEAFIVIDAKPLLVINPRAVFG